MNVVITIIDIRDFVVEQCVLFENYLIMKEK